MNNIVPIILCTQKPIETLIPYLDLCENFTNKCFIVAEQSVQFEILQLVDNHSVKLNIELILLPQCRGSAPAAAVAALLLNKQYPDAHAFILDTAIGDKQFDGLLSSVYLLMKYPLNHQLTKIHANDTENSLQGQERCHYFAANSTFLGLLKILQLACYLCSSRCADLAQPNTDLCYKRYYFPQHLYRQGLSMDLADALRHAGSCLKTVSYHSHCTSPLENAA